jgi:hypothetical protein
VAERSLVFFSYGMGVDSTAILLRWLFEPESRDFDLRDLVILSAMTGDEWPQTGQMVTDLVLPLIRAHRIHFIQVARAGPKQADGVRILDDSRAPRRLFIEGAYALSQEMLTAGTVPQCGGGRRCSAKAKAWPLEQVIARIAGGRPYWHVLGFELNEFKRATRDAKYNTAQRVGRYPLIEWEWDRRTCEDYVLRKLGVVFPKSACVYCPFSLVTAEGRARTLERFAADPQAGVAALFMEHVAVALNPRQGLIAGARLYDILTATPGQEQVLALLEDRLNASEWALYHVRRALLPSARRPDRAGTSARDLRAVAIGDRAAMKRALAGRARRGGVDLDISDPRHPRVWLHRRGEYLPAIESYYAIAPHTALDKTAPGFASAWKKATTTPPTAPVVIRTRDGLRARLELACQLTGQSLNAALAEALESWVSAHESDPAVWDRALARLDAEERVLAERRRALLALTGDEPAQPVSVPPHHAHNTKE